jgi:cold shock CspA family protein
METSLNEGDVVEFEVETSDRGPQAKNIKKA